MRWMEEMWKDPAADLCKISTEDHHEFIRGLVNKAANYNLMWDKKQAAAAN